MKITAHVSYACEAEVSARPYARRTRWHLVVKGRKEKGEHVYGAVFVTKPTKRQVRKLVKDVKFLIGV